eukprot:4230070-Pleurochrysis_carterae.AAC.1
MIRSRAKECASQTEFSGLERSVGAARQLGSNRVGGDAVGLRARLRHALRRAHPGTQCDSCVEFIESCMD